ncbi:MAG TPA: aromatic ring-hydroxylating dioxygenase subunit alpha [Arenicellales bacterium]|nr:aromatic ring-hydroxylating dioxygenase subunit alpha [Arenicellales bacterium]HJP10273.1 aromatic ring-hydroxylating dioxygenase subunit alpha [Arenicellales bacterium]
MIDGLDRGLPNRYYDNRQDFVAERQKIFAPMWVCIGFASDAPAPGDVYPLEFMELPLLLVRDNDGGLRVFHNVCRHRGHILVTKPGTLGQSLRCPYHSWTYALDGALLRTPHIGGSGVHDASGFERSKYPLVAVRSALWNDLVFVNLDGEAGPFDQFIEPLEKRWADLWGASGPGELRCAPDHSSITFELDTNWKLAVENFLEAYHLPTVHPDLNTISPLNAHEIYISHHFAGQLAHSYNLNIGAGEHLPVFSDWPPQSLGEAEYPALFPNTLLGLQADHLFVMVVIPLAYDRTREETRLYCAGDSALAEKYRPRRSEQHAFWTRVFQEDVSAVTGMQKGRASPGFDGGVLSPVMDTATAAFHRWAAERLGVNRTVPSES